MQLWLSLVEFGSRLQLGDCPEPRLARTPDSDGRRRGAADGFSVWPPAPIKQLSLQASRQRKMNGPVCFQPPCLENKHLCLPMLRHVATLLAQATVPAPIAAAIALGRPVALRKPSGGARGLVVGDLLRRLVARTLAQQFSQQLNAACHPTPVCTLHADRSGGARAHPASQDSSRPSPHGPVR